MKDPFKNPLAPKKREEGKFPWSFKSPTKDQAMSGSVHAGESHGVGHKQPVGKMNHSGKLAIPKECRHTTVDRLIHGEKE